MSKGIAGQLVNREERWKKDLLVILNWLLYSGGRDVGAERGGGVGKQAQSGGVEYRRQRQLEPLYLVPVSQEGASVIPAKRTCVINEEKLNIARKSSLDNDKGVLSYFLDLDIKSGKTKWFLQS